MSVLATKSSGTLFVISGPAGAGKGTLVGRLVKCLPSVLVSTSATTRAPRGTEQNGVEYFFYTTEQFEDMIAHDQFLEWAHVHNNYYGTPVLPIREHLDSGDDVILEIDVQGALQVRDRFPEAHLIFIAPPDMETLESRLRGRGTDSEDSIQTRLANAVGEMEVSKDYDRIIVNDDLDRATEELVNVVQSFVSSERD